MNIKNVTVAGSGVLGAQIAFQSALHGYTVSIYDINDTILEKAHAIFRKIGQAIINDLGTTQEQINLAMSRLNYFSDLQESCKNADLVIEAIPENIEIKTEFYKKLATLAPPQTIFATNSSTLLPSQFAESTGRPSRFLALHFANEIWKCNTAEIMGHPGTDPSVFNEIVNFAKSIGMVALPLYKEQAGYIVNSLLVPFLTAATSLLSKGVADAHTIDKTWMVSQGAHIGPFGLMDIIGITTVYNIAKIQAEKTNDPEVYKKVQFLKEQFIDTGNLGVASGKGFYNYPNPEYKKPAFLK